ncbi:MAG: hypothetical protein IJ545_07130 [Alphaproteobacteria bacterium]|nr:hypothetical protein [Alphaproteobacteria bacterium]
MQKLINLANWLCVAVVLFIASTVNEGIYGQWKNTSDVTVFSDKINIVKLRTREGSNFPYYTLIYDDNFHASACQKNQDNKDICLSLLLKTTNIHPTDEISSVIAAPIDNRDYILSTNLEHRLGYNLLHWKMTFPQHNNQQIEQTFRRDWF